MSSDAIIIKRRMILCTYFDSVFLARGLALYESLVRHWPDFELLVLCLDAEVERALRRLALSRVRILPLDELERIDSELRLVRGTRSRVGYYMTCTPVLLRHALRDADVAIYLDADLYFFSSPTPALDGFAKGSIYIHEHQQGHPDWDRTAGRFNVGLVAARNDQQGRACVDLWRRRCLEWCDYARVDGRFGDQRYLEEWPSLFDRLVVSDHPGVGAMVDNLHGRRYARDRDGTVLVDGVPLVFFHFTLLKEIAPGVVRTYATVFSGGPLDSVVRQSVYRPYLRSVRAQAHRLQRVGIPARAFARPRRIVAGPAAAASEANPIWRRAVSLVKGLRSGELMLSWGPWAL